MKKFIIVLQGEYAVVNASEMSIVTSKPHTCNVLFAYEKRSNLIGLLHIDSYTAAADITQQLFDDFQKKLQEQNIVNPEYNILYARGLSDGKDANELTINQKQIEDMLRISKKYAETINTINLSPVEQGRHPFEFTIAHNEIALKMLVPMTYTYNIIQHLQGMEYGDFNKFLNRCFGTKDPHFFLGKEASRYDTDLPDEKSLPAIIYAEVLETHLEPLVRFERTAEVRPTILESLNELINKCDITTEEKKTFEATFAKKQYNLALRQAATKTAFLSILNFLLKNSLEFGLDNASRGQKSGTAIDVATIRKNNSAHSALSLFKEKQQQNSDDIDIHHGKIPSKMK